MLRLILAGSIALFALNASAQPAAPDPVMAAYREYVAAEQSGDLAKAEAAAERAWRASEAQSGDGGKTAILALNLAMLRLAVHHDAAAVEPARRASTLADKGAAGVDPLMARLALGAALAAENYPEAKQILPPALSAARGAGQDVRAAAYTAATALAHASMAKKDFQVSRDAWATAFDMADAGEGNVEILRANTLIGRGATFLGSRKDLDAIAALEAFNQALARLAPLTPERDDDNTTPVQILYAQALAWSSAARALIRSQPPQHTTGSHLDAKDKGPPSSPLNTGRPQLGGKPPLCPVRFKTMPRIFYPTFAENSSGVGAVVMRLKVDAAGTVLSRNVVASIPTPEFGESVRAAEGLWVVEPAEGAPAGCRLESADLLMPVHFVISQ